MIDNAGWMLAGGAAVTGCIAAGWGYIKSIWSQLSSRIVVTCEVSSGLGDALRTYLWQKSSVSNYGIRSYTGWSMFVRPISRVQLIAMEMLGGSGKLCWLGWKPVLVSAAAESPNKSPDETVKIRFIRGTLDPDSLILDAVDKYNSVVMAIDGKRHCIKHIFGTAGKPMQKNDNEIYAHPSQGLAESNYDPSVCARHRVLRWKLGDLGANTSGSGNALDDLALSEDAQEMVDEARRWKMSEKWYKERGIPWRRGWLLHGEPGVGKTSLVRAIAEDLDLPIYTYDLSTLYNDELQRHWQSMLTKVPCIALIEDIDTVFDGRNNTAGTNLTFDCLLNCLDGVQRTDGVLLMMTTNHPEKLDEALGVGSNGVSSRPGRIDKVLQLLPLDEQGRRKICKRILNEHPELCDEVVEDCDGYTGAQLQDYCAQLALRLFWDRDPDDYKVDDSSQCIIS